jgi:hypothetical protein
MYSETTITGAPEPLEFRIRRRVMNFVTGFKTPITSATHELQGGQLVGKMKEEDEFY